MPNRLTNLIPDNGYRYGLLLYPWHFSSDAALKCLDHPKTLVVTRTKDMYDCDTCNYEDYTKILSFINGVGKRLLFVDDLLTLMEIQMIRDKQYSEYMTLSENPDVQIIFSATTGITKQNVDILTSFFPKILIVSVMTDLPAPEVESLNLQFGLTLDAIRNRMYTIMKLNPIETQSACTLDLCLTNKDEGIVGMIDKLHIMCGNDYMITSKELINLIRKCLDTSKGIRQNNLVVYIYYDRTVDINQLTDSYYSTVNYFNVLLDKSIRSYYDPNKGYFVA